MKIGKKKTTMELWDYQEWIPEVQIPEVQQKDEALIRMSKCFL